MDATIFHDRDGLLQPKRLQDRCIELLSCLIVESVRRFGDGDHVQYEQQEHLRLGLHATRTQQIGKGRVSPSHFQAEVEEGILRHLRAYIGVDGVLGAEGTLPGHFCDQILAHLSSKNWLTDQLVGFMCHRSFGCTTKLPSCIKPCPLRLSTLQMLAQQPLVELSLDLSQSNRPHARISWQDFSIVFGNSSLCFTLRSLSLSHVQIHVVELDIENFEWLSRLQCLMRLHFSNLVLPYQCTIADLSKLPHLTIFSVTNSNLFSMPCKNMNTVRQLTLSNAVLNTNMANVLSLRNLVSLDIAKTSLEDDRVHLRTLLPCADWVLKLSQLPLLKYLDVSRHTVSVDDIRHFDVPHHRMNFLGLLSTQACMKRDINSNVVAGDSSEGQLVVSLQVYRDNTALLRYALRKLYEELNAHRVNTSNKDMLQALLVILERTSHWNELSRTIYTSASACLYHFLLEVPLEEHIDDFTTRKIIVVLLKTLEGLLYDHQDQDDNCDQAIFNMVACLVRFTYPNNAIFVYSRMAKILSLLAQYDRDDGDGDVRERAVVIMNSFVWQVSLEKKQLMKTYKGIEAVVDFITNRIQDQKCDFYLECAWSFLWNVTDETPANCAEFLDCNGLQVLIDCYETFKDEDDDFTDALRNMLGALGNVAEVKALRPRLLDPRILHIFITVLSTFQDMEVQYNVSGVIVNLAMEDKCLWSPIQQPSQDYLLDLVVAAVLKWDLTEQREIQYRSLLPIIRCVDYHDDRVALWGVWALANFCQIDTTKYVPMFLSEGGPQAVEELRSRAELPLVRELASKVLTITEQNKKARMDL